MQRQTISLHFSNTSHTFFTDTIMAGKLLSPAITGALLFALTSSPDRVREPLLAQLRQYLSIENCWHVHVAPVGETWDAELGTVTESPKFKMINLERWPEATRRIMTDLRVSGYMRDIKTICIATPLSSISESWKEIRFLCKNVGSRLEELHLNVPQGRRIFFLPGKLISGSWSGSLLTKGLLSRGIVPN